MPSFNPFDLNSTQQTPPGAPPLSADFGGQTVLVVDDNEINLEIAQELLQDQNLRVITCTSGKAAWELIAHDRPGLILMDIQMPDWDGLTTTREIRKRYPYEDLFIIALSGNHEPEDKAESLAAGMQGHLAKPLNTDDLIKTLCHYLPHQKQPQVISESASDAQAPISFPLSPDVSTAELAGVDLDDALQRLRGNRKLFDDVFLSFAQGCQTTIEQLDAAIADQDQVATTRILHRLKGTAANLSANSLAKIAAELESQSKRGQLPDCRQVKILDVALQEIITAAETLKTQPPDPVLPVAASAELIATLTSLAMDITSQIDVDLGMAQDSVESFFESSRGTEIEIIALQLRTEFYNFNIRKLKTLVNDWLLNSRGTNDA